MKIMVKHHRFDIREPHQRRGALKVAGKRRKPDYIRTSSRRGQNPPVFRLPVDFIPRNVDPSADNVRVLMMSLPHSTGRDIIRTVESDELYEFLETANFDPTRMQFHSLPPEIRALIYDLLLPETVRVRSDSTIGPATLELPYPNNVPTMAFLRTSRRIHDELFDQALRTRRLVFWDLNVFLSFLRRHNLEHPPETSTGGVLGKIKDLEIGFTPPQTATLLEIRWSAKPAAPPASLRLPGQTLREFRRRLEGFTGLKRLSFTLAWDGEDYAEYGIGEDADLAWERLAGFGRYLPFPIRDLGNVFMSMSVPEGKTWGRWDKGEKSVEEVRGLIAGDDG